MRRGKKKGGARKTHYALAQAGETDYGKMTPAASIGPCVKHFFPMEETTGNTKVTDIVAGVEINETQGTIAIADGVPGLRVNIVSGASDAIVGNWTEPGDKDVLILACARCKFEGVETGDGGFVEFAFGDSTDQQLRVQPYYSLWANGNDGVMPTPVYNPYLVRTTDQDLICASVKRGNTLEHYVDGILTGTNDITLSSSAMQAKWNNFVAGDVIALGHAAYAQDICLVPDTLGIEATTCGAVAASQPQWVDRGSNAEVPSTFDPLEGNNSSAGDFAQDYYGLLVCVFEDGAPNDIAEAIAWMKIQWLAGNKVIWPGWVTLV